MRHVPRHVPGTWGEKRCGSVFTSMVGGDVLRGLCSLAQRNAEGVVCKLRQRVLSGETEGEARAAARARHLGEKRCGSVFTSVVGREVWRMEGARLHEET